MGVIRVSRVAGQIGLSHGNGLSIENTSDFCRRREITRIAASLVETNRVSSHIRLDGTSICYVAFAHRIGWYRTP